MHRVILYSACSADGAIARPDGGVGWLEAHAAGNKDHGHPDVMTPVDTVFLGRKTWDPAISFAEDPHPRQHRSVYTHRPPAPRERVTLGDPPPAALATLLRAQPGGDMWLVGGAMLNTAVAQAGLIDETGPFVVPTLLGTGAPPYRPGAPEQTLRLLDCHAYAAELVRLRHVHGAPAGTSPTSGD